MNNRSQAALDFLMRFWWVILLIFLAIGVLAYFGLLKEKQICYNEDYPIKRFPRACDEVAQALLSNTDLTIEVQSYKICRYLNGTIISNQTDGNIHDAPFLDMEDYYKNKCLLK